jgi:hypothetical protein
MMFAPAPEHVPASSRNLSAPCSDIKLDILDVYNFAVGGCELLLPAVSLAVDAGKPADPSPPPHPVRNMHKQRFTQKETVIFKMSPLS